MKKLITIKNEQRIIYSHVCENNSLEITINKACRDTIDLSGADFTHAFLKKTDLSYHDLSGANFKNADFREANISYVNFRNADLSYADFTGANLTNTSLEGAILTGANFSGTNLNCVFGKKYAYCCFSSDGAGRGITAIEIDGEIMFFSEWFNGNESEMRNFIDNVLNRRFANGYNIALETVLKLIKIDRE